MTIMAHIQNPKIAIGISSKLSGELEFGYQIPFPLVVRCECLSKGAIGILASKREEGICAFALILFEIVVG
jgi:hypothetical protein